MSREGNLEPPDPASHRLEEPRLLRRRRAARRTGARLRHLPRLPALRQPVQRLPAAVRPRGRSATGEIDGVPKEKFWEVVDQCYLCDVCFMTKCPYVPPHEWNLDFPHLMLRAKAIKYKTGKIKFRDKLLDQD